MRFPGFYGNDSLKMRLSAAGDRLSHCYILEGPAGSGKKTLAGLLAAAMECTTPGEKPCGTCPACRKATKGEHPDIITVDSDTATVPIRLIRQMQADAYIRPNEGRRKIYIIPRANTMQAPAQNALLKLLEEPPAYCSFLLLTDTAEKLLETVRSRAVTLTLAPLSAPQLSAAMRAQLPGTSQEEIDRAADRSGGYLGAALQLLGTPDTAMEEKAQSVASAFASGDELELVQTLTPLEKLSRTDLLQVLTILQRLFVRTMDPGGSSSVLSRCSSKQLYAGTQAIAHAITLLQANGSSGHAVGCLMASMRP